MVEVINALADQGFVTPSKQKNDDIKNLSSKFLGNILAELLRRQEFLEDYCGPLSSFVIVTLAAGSDLPLLLAVGAIITSVDD